jgi:threonine dehydrogenase-like Zn-dependent dehydrogenase
MKALCWYGKNDVRVETVPEPKIINPRDAIIKTTLTAICGSDLHLLHGYIPSMQQGDILGHEFMGEVLEVGSDVTNLKKGDRVVVPFTIACGRCWFCQQGLTSLCDNSNPNASAAEKLYGYSASGLFGYSHIFGGYAGGQAQYVRVPFSDTACYKVPESLKDEQVLFLSDIFPTGYMAAENCNIHAGDTVAIWGCGPVGQFAIRSAFMLGAERVIAIDRVPERLRMAEEGGAETINFEEVDDVVQLLKDMTGNIGPDACIDAVGMEATGHGFLYAMDRAKQAMKMTPDRPYVLRECIMACRKGGRLSIPGVYGGFDDMIPMVALMNKGLTVKSGQTHMMRFMRPLLDRVERGDIDPSFVVSHRVPIAKAPEMYRLFRDKQDQCTKVVLDPWADGAAA